MKKTNRPLPLPLPLPLSVPLPLLLPLSLPLLLFLTVILTSKFYSFPPLDWSGNITRSCLRSRKKIEFGVDSNGESILKTKTILIFYSTPWKIALGGAVINAIMTGMSVVFIIGRCHCRRCCCCCCCCCCFLFSLSDNSGVLLHIQRILHPVPCLLRICLLETIT